MKNILVCEVCVKTLWYMEVKNLLFKTACISLNHLNVSWKGPLEII